MLRQRLVNKMRICRFRVEDFFDRLFGRLRVVDTFSLLRELESDPPEDEFSSLLELDGHAMVYMTDEECDQYRQRMVRLREHVRTGIPIPRTDGKVKYFETEEDLEKRREVFRNYKF
jgi:hypothetical protein